MQPSHFTKGVITLITFIILTVVTQIGGIALLISKLFVKTFKLKGFTREIGVFLSVYFVFTFVIVPVVAPYFGRERVKHNDIVRPANYLTLVLNRNYVTPQLNKLISGTATTLHNSTVKIQYLDANFPFFDGFPLIPHLSHNDGKKIDFSLIYETPTGVITNKCKSISGYGSFEGPSSKEYNQIQKCLDQGYEQYNLTRFLSLGHINNDLRFSSNGTKQLIQALLQQSTLGKIFIEPHLKSRMGLNNDKIRYHGCRAVRHDDHIHVQL